MVRNLLRKKIKFRAIGYHIHYARCFLIYNRELYENLDRQ